MSGESVPEIHSELDFSEFVDEAPFGVLTIDHNSTVLYANREIEAILGYAPTELVGEPLDVLIPPYLRKRHHDSFGEYRATGERHVDWEHVELPGLHRQGHEVPLALTFREHTVDGGSVYTGIVRDVTEQKRRERELARSNEDLERFAYVVSHDMREPLRMVSSYLQLLERRYADELDEDAEEFIEYAVDGAERMRRMIEDLLEYSRAGREEVDRRPVDCNDVLEAVRSNLRVALDESDADLVVGELPAVNADRGQLVQLFQNLVDNAVRHSEGSPAIEITASTHRGDGPPPIEAPDATDLSGWVVSVSDDGPGIPPDKTDEVFDLFAGSDRSDSTGIGLAICRRIVERHGGEMWVESTPGEGTTFSFTVPGVADSTDD